MNGDAKGTYVLLLRSPRQRRLRVGSLGTVELRDGLLLYVGSAFGPGGLRARLARHAAREKPRHWHVDYVRRQTAVEGAWACVSTRDLEHRWAAAIEALSGSRTPARRFGASDCRCHAHLFALTGAGAVRSALAALQAATDAPVVTLSPRDLHALRRGRVQPDPFLFVSTMTKMVSLGLPDRCGRRTVATAGGE